MTVRRRLKFTANGDVSTARKPRLESAVSSKIDTGESKATRATDAGESRELEILRRENRKWRRRYEREAAVNTELGRRAKAFKSNLEVAQARIEELEKEVKILRARRDALLGTGGGVNMTLASAAKKYKEESKAASMRVERLLRVVKMHGIPEEDVVEILPPCKNEEQGAAPLAEDAEPGARIVEIGACAAESSKVTCSVENEEVAAYPRKLFESFFVATIEPGQQTATKTSFAFPSVDKLPPNVLQFCLLTPRAPEKCLQLTRARRCIL